VRSGLGPLFGLKWGFGSIFDVFSDIEAYPDSRTTYSRVHEFFFRPYGATSSHRVSLRSYGMILGHRASPWALRCGLGLRSSPSSLVK
ncbi:hypothetical protein PanWU01x14_218090, partial [Parasponia andersonii]